MARKPQPQLIEAQWELARRLPPPRRVRSRGGTRFLYGLLLAGFVVAPAAAAGIVIQNYFERETFLSRGVSTTGRVVGVEIGSAEATSTHVDYEFEVDGKTNRFDVVFNGSQYMQKGPAEVVYLPEDPERATSRSYLSLPFFDTQSGVLIVAGVCLLVIGGPAGWFLTRSFRRHGRLLARGLPAVATIDAVVNRKDDERKVDFAFQAGGSLQQGSVVVDGAAAEKVESGQRLAMLYDPADPRSTDLFFAVVESYLIVDSNPLQVAAAKP